MSYWSEIRNTHYETEFNPTIDGAIVRIIFIDAWRGDSDEGCVIAKVVLSASGDVCVVYFNSIARTDAYAQEVIQEAIRAITRDG